MSEDEKKLLEKLGAAFCKECNIPIKPDTHMLWCTKCYLKTMTKSLSDDEEEYFRKHPIPRKRSY